MYEDILNKQIESEKYYNIEDLRVNRKIGFMLSHKQLQEFLGYKENCTVSTKINLPLLSWNSNGVFYYKCKELIDSINDYQYFFKDDIATTMSSYIQRNINEISIGIICSELEGTLKIEGVNTTRRQIESIIKSNDITDLNSRIIINMHKGLEFVSSKPAFNKDNLKKLYTLLSDGCLNENDIIGNNYYRNDIVYVGDYVGCPVDKIDECMESLFKFVNDQIGKTSNSLYNLLIPFIAHYYLVYIHPYFDYNGRTARMVQIWMYMLLDSIPSLYLSEAINDNKSLYYKALENTRNTRNDLTYFLIYLTKLSNSYYMVHKNLENIKQTIESEGESISQSELFYLKRIILNKNIKWFNYKSFISFAGIDVTKQGALKILNGLEDKEILLAKLNSSKEKIFILNDSIIAYEI